MFTHWIVHANSNWYLFQHEKYCNQIKLKSMETLFESQQWNWMYSVSIKFILTNEKMFSWIFRICNQYSLRQLCSLAKMYAFVFHSRFCLEWCKFTLPIMEVYFNQLQNTYVHKLCRSEYWHIIKPIGCQWQRCTVKNNQEEAIINVKQHKCHHSLMEKFQTTSHDRCNRNIAWKWCFWCHVMIMLLSLYAHFILLCVGSFILLKTCQHPSLMNHFCDVPNPQFVVLLILWCPYVFIFIMAICNKHKQEGATKRDKHNICNCEVIMIN